MISLVSKIWKVIMNPSKVIDCLRYKYMLRNANTLELCDYLYKRTFKRKINWDNPEDLNQWIAWLQFKTDTTLWTTLADKYRMHDYLKEKGFGEYLVPVLAKWDSADDIDFTNLPDSFVLKCNNGSGDVRIVTDKSKTDIAEIIEYFREQMSRDFGRESAEPHYRRIKPLIIAEKLLDTSCQSIESSSLIDYKFWCFNGKVNHIFVCSDRTKQHFTVDLYDASWNQISEGNLNFDEQHLCAQKRMPMPSNFYKMKAIASELSKGFPQIRIDFYEVNNKIYIGELTLTSMCGRMGYFTDKCLIEMGKLCNEAVKELKIHENKYKMNI